MIAAQPPAAASPQRPSGLESYRNASRVLVISAPSASDPGLIAQRAAFKGQGYSIDARDIVVVELVGAKVPPGDPPIDPARARHAAGLRADRFGVTLIGKDGHVALHSDRPLSAAKIFAAIDAMPMRRDEMRRGR